VKYPKINSLFKREGGNYKPGEFKTLTPEKKAIRNRFIEGDYAQDHFPNIRNWLVTEKINGMNVRCHFTKIDGGKWHKNFLGRTDAAQMPPKLLKHLENQFADDLLSELFSEATEVFLFGEGYGPKIQNGDWYSKEQRFALFDVLINGKWWMEYDVVREMAKKLDIPTAPMIGIMREQQIIDYVKGSKQCPSSPLSVFADVSQCKMEGIVARAYPMVLDRNGLPIKFKLKCRDFKEGG